MKHLKMCSNEINEKLNEFDVFIFDFDGVIVDSLAIKEEGFRRLFLPFGEEVANAACKYHRQHGGVSREEKIRYIFENVVGYEADEITIDECKSRFSEVTLSLLKNKSLLIANTIRYIRNVKKNKRVYIASAADESDVKELCKFYNIYNYFSGIFGSPKNKVDIVKDILKLEARSSCAMIGDSKSDLKAAKENNVVFFGYNNRYLEGASNYIWSFSENKKM